MRKITSGTKVNVKSNRKRKAGIFLLSVVLFVLLAALSPVSAWIASDGSVVEANHSLSEIKYKVIQIESGDSLWSIAEDNMDPGFWSIQEYIAEIRECNQLENDRITAGHYLMIPYYEETAGTSVVSIQ